MTRSRRTSRSRHALDEGRDPRDHRVERRLAHQPEKPKRDQEGPEPPVPLHYARSSCAGCVARPPPEARARRNASRNGGADPSCITAQVGPHRLAIPANASMARNQSPRPEVCQPATSSCSPNARPIHKQPGRDSRPTPRRTPLAYAPIRAAYRFGGSVSLCGVFAALVGNTDIHIEG